MDLVFLVIVILNQCAIFLKKTLFQCEVANLKLYDQKAFQIWSNVFSSAHFFMPRKRKSVMASIENGKRSGEDREVKRKRRKDGRIIADKENEVSLHEDHLERNMLAALEAVPLKSMRKFATRSWHFMDVYARGLNGRQAAWVARKYRGHRVLPEGILEELDKKHIV